MTKKEFIDKWCVVDEGRYGVEWHYEECADDLNGIIRDELRKFILEHSDDDYYFDSECIEEIIDEYLEYQKLNQK